MVLTLAEADTVMDTDTVTVMDTDTDTDTVMGTVMDTVMDQDIMTSLKSKKNHFL